MVSDGSEAVSVPGAAVSMLPARIHAPADPPDWFPDEHSPAPPVVMVGATPTTYACGYCHLADGHGRPENAKLAGLPADYILRQLRALRSAERREGLSGWLPTQLMITLATNLTDADARAAAEYFANQHARTSVRVIEAADVPPHAATCYVNDVSAGAARPLGQRIVEIPDDPERFERRDPHVGYTAYVPQGSLARGQRLADGGRAGTPGCATCHGSGLRGGPTAAGPPLAGRFPGYLFRQLEAFRSGARSSDEAAPMRAVAASLSESDLIDAVAYAASLAP